MMMNFGVRENVPALPRGDRVCLRVMIAIHAAAVCRLLA
jgi:hypothetical protein